MARATWADTVACKDSILDPRRERAARYSEAEQGANMARDVSQFPAQQTTLHYVVGGLRKGNGVLASRGLFCTLREPQCLLIVFILIKSQLLKCLKNVLKKISTPIYVNYIIRSTFMGNYKGTH